MKYLISIIGTLLLGTASYGADINLIVFTESPFAQPSKAFELYVVINNNSRRPLLIQDFGKGVSITWKIWNGKTLEVDASRSGDSLSLSSHSGRAMSLKAGGMFRRIIPFSISDLHAGDLIELSIAIPPDLSPTKKEIQSNAIMLLCIEGAK